MNLHFVDIDGDLVNAWLKAFGQFPEVTIQQGDLLAVAKHCVVSPANSHGFMDGGIDAAYRVAPKLSTQSGMRSTGGLKASCPLARAWWSGRDIRECLI